MKNIVLFLLFTLQLPAVFAQKDKGTENNYIIEGSIKGVEKGRVKLFYGGIKLNQKIERGKFLFSGHIDSTYRARLRYRGYKSKLFYLDSTTIKVSLYKDKALDKQADRPTLYFKYIKGSLTNDLEQDYKKFYKENFGDQAFNYRLYNYLNLKITKYPKNRFYYDLLHNMIGHQKYLNYKQYLDLSYKLDLKQVKPSQNRHFVRSLQNAMFMGIGSKFPSTQLHSLEAKKIELADLYGKLTLIHIWRYRNWSTLKINDKYLDLLKRYKPKGFEFLVINIHTNDEDISSLKNENKPEWAAYHSFDLFNKLKLPRTFNFRSFLIDEKGVIIDVNIWSTKELEKIIESRL